MDRSGMLVVEAPVRPSEDEGRVRTALLNIFPDLRVVREGDTLVGAGESLSRFSELLRRQRIRDAARRVLHRGMKGEGLTVFRLNKQAAFVGKVSFSEGESPLGDITVRLEHPGLRALIDGIAPDTKRPRGTDGGSFGAQMRGRPEARRGTKRERWEWRRELEGYGEEE
ncbi:MAG: RNA-binding domain-containing protein [Thermoplasmatota archaeon]